MEPRVLSFELQGGFDARARERLLADSAPAYCHHAQQIAHFNVPVLPIKEL